MIRIPTRYKMAVLDQLSWISLFSVILTLRGRSNGPWGSSVIALYSCTHSELQSPVSLSPPDGPCAATFLAKPALQLPPLWLPFSLHYISIPIQTTPGMKGKSKTCTTLVSSVTHSHDGAPRSEPALTLSHIVFYLR